MFISNLKEFIKKGDFQIMLKYIDNTIANVILFSNLIRSLIITLKSFSGFTNVGS